MRKLLLILLILPVSIVVHSQNENPFKEFGYDVLVATSSKGEFQEFHDQTDIVEIGSILFNRHTKEIVKVLDKDETTIDISSATAAMSIDPLCEKYYWISPYVYVANNPIRAIDIKGDSITVLNMGYGTNQHVALLIQNDKGKWQYFSVNGDNVYASGNHTGGREFDDLAVGEFDSPQQFLASAYNSKGKDENDKKNNKNINGYEFTEGFILPTTPEQDNKIRSTFTDISNNEDYGLNPFSPNHCGTAVQRSLEAVGIDVSEKTTARRRKVSVTMKTHPYLPSNAFKTIRKNNPQGAYIKK